MCTQSGSALYLEPRPGGRPARAAAVLPAPPENAAAGSAAAAVGPVHGVRRHVGHTTSADAGPVALTLVLAAPRPRAVVLLYHGQEVRNCDV